MSHLANHHRHVGCFEFFANISNQISQILFISQPAVVVLIVPALEPNKAFDLIPLPFVRRESIRQVGQAIVNFTDHVAIIFAELFFVLLHRDHFSRFERAQSLFLFRRFVLLGHAFIVGFDFCRLGCVPCFVLFVLLLSLLRILSICQHRRWWQKASRERSATPRRFDDQNLFVKVVANNVSKIKFRPKAFLRSTVADS